TRRAGSARTWMNHCRPALIGPNGEPASKAASVVANLASVSSPTTRTKSIPTTAGKAIGTARPRIKKQVKTVGGARRKTTDEDSGLVGRVRRSLYRSRYG